MIDEKHFMGRDGFYWFFGRVVDRNDPLSLGRVRVRVFGIHPDGPAGEQLVPDDHLPWAIPIQPVTSAGIFGIGHSATGLLPGSHVLGFFADGQDAQVPVVLGSIASSLGHYVVQAVDNLSQSAEAAAKQVAHAADVVKTTASTLINNLDTSPAKGHTKGKVGQILDLIAKWEAVPPYSYTAVIGSNVGLPDLTSYTVDQVIAYGRKLLNTPGSTAKKLNSTAMGRYQQVGTNLTNWIRDKKLKGSEIFNEALQDRLCIKVLQEHSADPHKFLAGSITTEEFIAKAATAFQSWPLNPNGTVIKKAGGGNSKYSWNELVTLLNKIKDGK